MVEPIARHDKTEPEVLDYKTACVIMADLHSRENWSTPHVLAQWVAEIRAHGRAEQRDLMRTT